VIFVRWRRGESRLGKTFDGLDETDASAAHPCIVCGYANGAGVPVQLFIVGPLPDAEHVEDREKFEAGRWFNAGAAVGHASCLAALTPDELDALAAQCVPASDADAREVAK